VASAQTSPHAPGQRDAPLSTLGPKPQS
jgi:hypothetical protein